MKEVTDKMREIADKLKKNEMLSPGERNLAKNILIEQADIIDAKRTISTNVEKSNDIDKIKHRTKVLKYRIKKRLNELMENVD
jgi:predicted lipoprotein